jgi:glucokinase
MKSVIAVDLGGTKLSAAVVDETGRVLQRTRSGVEAVDFDASVRQIADVIHDTMRPSPKAVGLIVPGIYFPSTGNAWAPNLWGHEQVPLRRELERTVALPVVIDSDRAGYVMGERWLGAARGLDDVVFLSVGTGIGAGIVSGGRLIRGTGDIAGAVGWFALNPKRQAIYREVGCWEAEAAGPGLARRLNAASAEEVVAAARLGDTRARQAVEETAVYLGMGLANIVSILNPEMVVLGGGVMQAGDLFLTSMRRAMTEWAQPVAAQQVRIEMTQLGDDAGLLGAARLALGD